MKLTKFIVDLLKLNVLFGARASKLTGLSDASLNVTLPIIASNLNTLTLTTPNWLVIGAQFRLVGAGTANDAQLYTVTARTPNTITLTPPLANTFTATISLDARRATIINDPTKAKLNAAGNTIFNVNAPTTDCPTDHYHDASGSITPTDPDLIDVPHPKWRLVGNERQIIGDRVEVVFTRVVKLEGESSMTLKDDANVTIL